MSRLEKEKSFAELAVKKGWATPEQGMRCAMEHVQSQGRTLIDQVFIRNKIISADQADEIWRELGGAPGLGASSHSRETFSRRPAPLRRTAAAPAPAASSRGSSGPAIAIAIGAVAVLGAALAVVSLTGNGSPTAPPPPPLRHAAEPRAASTPPPPPRPRSLSPHPLQRTPFPLRKNATFSRAPRSSSRTQRACSNRGRRSVQKNLSRKPGSRRRKRGSSSWRFRTWKVRPIFATASRK